MLGTTLFERWRIDEELGSGSFSTVYSGTDLHSLDPIAVKILNPEASRAMLDNEAKALTRLQTCASKGEYRSNKIAVLQ